MTTTDAIRLRSDWVGPNRAFNPLLYRMRRVKRIGEIEQSMQPWYIPKLVSLQMWRFLPSIHLAKMRYYFDDHVCLRCERRDILY